MGEGGQTKDLTSLVEFSARELSKHPQTPEDLPAEPPPPPPDMDPNPGPVGIQLPAFELPAMAANPPTIGTPASAPVTAPPPGASHAVTPGEPPKGKQDLSKVRQYGERIAIGAPALEANPPFSVLVTAAAGKGFNENARKAIEDAVGSEDFGIRIEDVRVQLDAGKLLVPRISEFAAITLAQKLRDAVPNIDLDLASEIYHGSAADDTPYPESVFLSNAEVLPQRMEEAHDLAAEPKSPDDLFSSNLPEVMDFRVTRILSTVAASEIIVAEVAEATGSTEFEAATERLTQELLARAFKLGAHGVIGVSFTLRPIEAHKDASGRIRRAYRLLGQGTAVRAAPKTR